MQRLLVPIVLLVVSVGAWIGADRLGNEAITIPDGEELAQSDTPVLSARRMPEFLIRPIAASALGTQLDAVVSEEFGGSCLQVTDGTEVLYDHQSTFPYTPASLQKLVTGFAALAELEPNARFTTRLMAEQTPEAGVLNGSVYLVGGGDPLLMTAEYSITFESQPQLRTPVEELVDQLVSQYNLTQINGGVLGVETLYDDERYPIGWPERYATQGQAGPIGALMVNDAFTTYPASPGAWLLGEVPVPADDPAAHAASLVDDLLEARAIVITSGSRNLPQSEFAAVEENLVELARIDSPPVSEIVRQMLTESDNTTAELLLKAIGLSESGTGSTLVGARSVVNILSEAGLSRLNVAPFDGSGLDASNKLSCSFLIELLQRAEPQTPFGDALPVAGRDGTLADRFLGTIAEGRVHAKTGSLTDVTALAGYVEADEEKILQFAYIVNLTEGREVTNALLDVQEDLVVALVAYPVGPSVEDVEPASASDLAAEALGIDPESLGADVEPTPVIDLSNIFQDPDETGDSGGG